MTEYDQSAEEVLDFLATVDPKEAKVSTRPTIATRLSSIAEKVRAAILAGHRPGLIAYKLVNSSDDVLHGKKSTSVRNEIIKMFAPEIAKARKRKLAKAPRSASASGTANAAESGPAAADDSATRHASIEQTTEATQPQQSHTNNVHSGARRAEV